MRSCDVPAIYLLLPSSAVHAWAISELMRHHWGYSIYFCSLVIYLSIARPRIIPNHWNNLSMAALDTEYMFNTTKHMSHQGNSDVIILSSAAELD